MGATVEELKFLLEGDSSGARAAVSQFAEVFHKTVSGLDGPTSKAGEKVNDLHDKLRAAFEDPIGSVKSLASTVGSDFVGSLGTAGVVAAGVTAVILGLGAAAFTLANRAADADSKLDDLADTTQVSVPALSRLEKAMTVLDRPLEQATNLIFVMQRQMAESPDEFQKGLGRIGLSMKDLEELEPDERLRRIASAFRDAGPEVNRAAVATELFTKQGRDAIPMLMDLEKAMAMTADMTPVTAEQAAAAEDYEMKIAALKLRFSDLVTTVGREVIPVVSFAVDVFVGAGKVVATVVEYTTPLVPIVHAVAEAYRYAAAAVAMFNSEGAKTPEVTGTAQRGLERYKQSVADTAIQVHKPGSDESLSAAFREATLSNAQLNAELEKSKKANEEAARAAKTQQDAIDNINRSQLAVAASDVIIIENLHAKGIAEGEIVKALKLTEAQVRLVIEAEKVRDDISATSKKLAIEREKQFREEQQKELEAHNKAQIDNLESGKAAEREYFDSVARMTLTSYQFQRFQLEQWRRDRLDALKEGEGNWASATASIERDFAAKMALVERDQQQAIAELTAAPGYWKQAWRSALSDLPQLFAQSFAGGGGLQGATQGIVSQFGGMLGQQLLDARHFGIPIAQGVSKLFGNAVGDAVGAMLPGIGALMGPALNSLFKLFGGSEESRLVNRPRELFIQTAGGIAELNDQVFKATGSLKLVQDLLHAKTEKDYKAAVDAINQSLAEFKRKLDAAHTSVQTIEQRMSHLRDLSPELQAALQRAYDASNIDDYAAALESINGVLDDQEAKQKQINDTLQKYGLTWQEAGDEVKAAHIDDLAKELVTDFKTLKGAQVDINHEMAAMSTPLNDFVKQAQKAGVDVPAGMQEVLQVAIDSGQLFKDAGFSVNDFATRAIQAGIEIPGPMQAVLASAIDAGVRYNVAGQSVDEFIRKAASAGVEIPDDMQAILRASEAAGVVIDGNGDKVTLLSQLGLTFGTTMTEATQKVADQIKRLADVLEKSLTPNFRSAAGAAQDLANAANSVPDEIHSRVRFDSDADVPGHATGGVFTRAHLARIAEAGEPEIVGPVGFMSSALAGAFEQMLGAGGLQRLAPASAAPTVVIQNDLRGAYFRDRNDIRDLAQDIMDNLDERIRLTTQLSLRTVG